MHVQHRTAGDNTPRNVTLTLTAHDCLRLAAYLRLVDHHGKWDTPRSKYHFATFPPKLIRPCILAGCPQGGTVLDPFGGSGTTGMVAEEEGRNSILIELNPKYASLARERTAQAGLFCNFEGGQA